MEFVTASKMQFIRGLLPRSQERRLAISLGCSCLNLSGGGWEMGLTTAGLCFGQCHPRTQEQNNQGREQSQVSDKSMNNFTAGLFCLWSYSKRADHLLPAVSSLEATQGRCWHKDRSPAPTHMDQNVPQWLCGEGSSSHLLTRDVGQSPSNAKCRIQVK